MIAETDPQFSTIWAVLFTWKDRFVKNVREMPVTTLAIHQIPTYPGLRPKPAPIKMYTQEESRWLQVYDNLPTMEEAQIIMRCTTPWAF